MKNLDKYVGRIVRLNEQALLSIKGIHRRGAALENCFIVAAVSHEMCQLICYGANIRVSVGAAEVLLI